MRRSIGDPVAVLLAVALLACGDPPPPPRFPVTFEAVSDPGSPLAGVAITANGTPVGSTGPDGSLRVELTGPEGSPVRIGATCPSGYRSPANLPTIALRPVVGLDPATVHRGLLVSIACPPTHRHGVVVVRAAGDQPQPNLPVLVDGREVARTDSSGVAHVALYMQPGTSFQVLLDTAAMPMLRPQNPRMSFAFPDSDEIFIFNQSFEVEQPPVRRPVRRQPAKQPPPIPQPVLPVRIGPTRR